MEQLSISRYTKKDQKEGKILFPEYAKEIQRNGLGVGKLKSIAVVENGTYKGKPAVELLIEVNHSGTKFYIMASALASAFQTGSESANKYADQFLFKQDAN